MKFIKQNILTIVTAIFILVLSTMPVGSFPEIAVPNIDKPIHFIMYAFFTMMMLMDRTLFHHHSTVYWYFYAPLIAIVYGGLMEIVQHLIGYRSCSIYDFYANDIGAVIGALLFALLHRLFHKP